MKIIDKIILCMFSVMILLISVLSSFVIFGWVDVTDTYIIITKLLADKVSCNILLVTVEIVDK